MTIYRNDLQRVYKLIEREDSWTQQGYARDKFGQFLDEEADGSDLKCATHEDAACWCLLGAGYKCGIKENEMKQALDRERLHEFNDSHTHDEVLQLLREAIERAPAREVTS